MILELDCGNSFIKWRLLCARSNKVLGKGVALGAEEMILEVSASGRGVPARCRLVSVRSDLETRQVMQRIAEAYGVQVERAEPARALGGVKNGYADYRQLGLDRWLAIVGAYSLCHKACLVIDLGTAVTVDLVASDGRHLGGFISPGMPLLRNQLQAHTRRIQYDEAAARAALAEMTPGSSTAEAVERGCLLMLRSHVESRLNAAVEQLGEGFEAFAAGGDITLVSDLAGLRHVPDLVFRGLAIACP